MKCATLLIAALLFPSTAYAGSDEGEVNEKQQHQDEDEKPYEVEFSSYGELSFSYLNYEANQTLEGGARRDNRLVFDQTRFVAKLEVEMPLGFEVEAEVEFEHGGTGSSMELEYEEFGEYEFEAEKGGEVVVEELYLKREFEDWGHVKLGRFYTAVGLLSGVHRPTELIAANRPESETTIIPAVWDEMGLEVAADIGPVILTGQIVNGLDSTGFSSQFWVMSGQQTRFETISGSGLAGILRVDVRPFDGLLAGVSAYYGQTTQNRPKADLALDCAKSDDTEVAPCGYLNGDVVILGAHAAYDGALIRARGSVLWGHLENARQISERNKSLSNNLNVLRSEVAEQAVSAWGELGVNIMQFIAPGDWRVEPHVRAEYYDTMFKVADGQFDPPRFERLVFAAGVGADYDDLVFARLTARHRAFGDDSIRSQVDVALTTGFSF